MSARAGVAGIVAAVAVLVAGATSGGAAGQAERLRAFSGCPSFLDHVRARALPVVGPWGLGGGGFVVAMPSAARAGTSGAGVDFSGTNVQEEGVDEPDLTKTDGRTLFVAANGRLNAVDVRQRSPRLL
ncbi:MAG TPA: beta-propeller domain-containing protein, partial [Gaiella sp.]|nr:beta-propeller domain-containing protein [Gaiella sp.]